MATPASERGTSTSDRGYPDLHDHIRTLREAGLLIQVDRPINKDTEMHPLVRWQFRGGIAPEDRTAFLFTNVTDSKGRKFDIPVLVCGLAGNNQIYSLGMGCKIEEIRDRWIKAMSHPIKPRVVENAACQEIVYTGDDLRKGHGLDAIPVPISTPGWDNAPYTTSSHFITEDPGHRHPEHGQLPGHDQGARPHGHEHLDRASHRRLHALGEVEGARQADALRGGARLPAGGVLHRGAEGAGDLRRARRHRRPDRAAAQRGEVQDRRPAGAGGGRGHHRGLCLDRVPRARGAVRRVATATSTCRNTTASST